MQNRGVGVGVPATRIVESAIGSERRDLNWKQHSAVRRPHRYASYVPEHDAVLSGPDAGERMASVELGAGMNYLTSRTETAAAVPGDPVIDIPIAQAFQWIVGGKN